MKKQQFANTPCSIARATDYLGDKWIPLILRECLYGNNRFDDIQNCLDVGRNILADRLVFLVETGLLEKQKYQDRPKRYTYQLTNKGYAAASVLLAFMSFSEAHLFGPGDEPIRLYDRETGQRIETVVIDKTTGLPVDIRRLVPGPGPSFPEDEKGRRARFSEYFHLNFDD